MNSVVTNNGPNKGLVQRAVFTDESKEVDLLGLFHRDILFSERLLLNSVDLRIKLIRNNDAFCLMGIWASEFVLKITAASLICNQENLFLGAIPKDVVLGMVHHSTFAGRRDLSPFNFRHNNVEYLVLCQDGRQVPAKAFQPQFDHGSSGYTLFVFNLESTEDSDALSPISSGNLRLEMRFRVPLPHTTTLSVYACDHSILEINAKRQTPTNTSSSAAAPSGQYPALSAPNDDPILILLPDWMCPVNLMGRDLLVKSGASILCGADGLIVTFPTGQLFNCSVGTLRPHSQMFLAADNSPNAEGEWADIYWGLVQPEPQEGGGVHS
eukprot:superscaffoldBa00002401_g14129